jgi:hypothetical protein
MIHTALERKKPMPHFFFHVRDIRQEALSRDEVGLDFPDVATACLMTFRAARDMQAAFAVCGWNPRDYSIEVVDAADELVFELPFTLVFGCEVARRSKLSS